MLCYDYSGNVLNVGVKLAWELFLVASTPLQMKGLDEYALRF